MELVTTREFNGVALQCYRDEVNQDDFWATREQIGQLLEYEYPREAIGKIHQRNKDRLDHFSSEVTLTTEAGTRLTTVYNFKGFLEICRFSNQPKANAVIDFAWNVMDEIRRTGSYNVNSVNIRAAELLKDIAQYASKEEKQEIVREAFKLATGHEMPKKEPPVTNQRYWTAEQIGKTLKWSANSVIHRALMLGIMNNDKNGYWADDIWYFNKEGRKNFLDFVSQGIEKIEDGYEYYSNGLKRIHWRFDPTEYKEEH